MKHKTSLNSSWIVNGGTSPSVLIFFFLRQSLPPGNWDRGHRPQSCVRSGVFLIRRVGVSDPGDESHFLFPSSAGYWKKSLEGVFLLSLQGPLFEY